MKCRITFSVLLLTQSKGLTKRPFTDMRLLKTYNGNSRIHAVHHILLLPLEISQHLWLSVFMDFKNHSVLTAKGEKGRV